MSTINLTGEELQDLYYLARSIIWRYQLDMVERKALEESLGVAMKAGLDAVALIKKTKSEWVRLRTEDVLKEIDALTIGIREQITGDISRLAGVAGEESYKFHVDTLSFGGKVPVGLVSLSADQFSSVFERSQLGGKTLGGWIDAAFEKSVIDAAKQEMQAGMLLGEGYPAMVKRLMSGMGDFTKQEAILIARTYVQAANVAAMQTVIETNTDIVDRWKWSAVLETSYKATGNGTCLRCAALDGQKFNVGEGPPIPLHPACRCVPIPVCKTWKELGLDLEELEDVTRPWTERPDVPVSEGGRNIIDYGFHDGEYSKWIEKRSKKFQVNAMGPKRYEMWKSGDVEFKDFVDRKTGRLLRIDEL